MKKIAICVPTLRFGGGERVAVNLINGLAKYRDLSIDVILYDEKQIDYEVANNINIISLEERTDINGIFNRGISFFRKVFKIRKIFKQRNIDVVLSIMPSMNIISLFSGHKNIIISEHNILRKDIPFFEKKISFILKKKLYIKANRIIAVSNGVKNNLNAVYPNLVVDVIYNPIDIEEISLRAHENIEEELNNYIVAVGRLHKQKGFDLLIKAFAKLNLNNLNLVIIGEGKEKDTLVSLISTLKIEHKVKLLGFKSNPYKYMKLAQCFVLSSRWEGFGLVLAEALVVNKNVIAFNCNYGPSEILLDGKIGTLVEAGNLNSLSNAIKRVLKEEVEENDVVINNQLKNFDLKYIVDKYHSIIMK